MGEIIASEGRVCIVKIRELTTLKDGLEKIKNTLIDFIGKKDAQQSNLNSYIFIDLTPFNIINSSLIGVLGSIIMDPDVQLVALCGVQPPVADILKRFGVISSKDQKPNYANSEIKDNLSKVYTFKTIEDGLAKLNPS